MEEKYSEARQAQVKVGIYEKKLQDISALTEKTRLLENDNIQLRNNNNFLIGE